MAKITLNFGTMNGRPELVGTKFESDSYGVIRAIRGRESGAYFGYNTFTWARAVKGFCVMAIEAALRSEEKGSYEQTPLLTGFKRSLAAAVDVSIYKKPRWTEEIFGLDKAGNVPIRRLISTSNPYLKRPGPVSLGINMKNLPYENIQVSLDGRKVTEVEDLSALKSALLAGEKGLASENALIENDF